MAAGWGDAPPTYPEKPMKTCVSRIGALLALLLLPASAEVVQVAPRASHNWLGYMNVFNLEANGGAFQFGSVWGVPDLRAILSSDQLSLRPNTIGDPNPYWYVGGGGPGAPGNKTMDANCYVQTGNGELGGKTVTFSGTVLSNTLSPTHTAIAFIRDFAPDYSTMVESRVVLAPGAFRISLDTINDPARHVQYGFQMVGPNVWETDAAAFGSVEISLEPLTPISPEVGIDPSAAWLGYVNVFNLPEPDDDGDFRQAFPVAPAALRASFDGDVLDFRPFTINPEPFGIEDSYWFQDDGSGFKSIESSVYVEPPAGSLNGKTVTFRGTVQQNTLTAAHSVVAFIRDYAPDYSSFQESFVPLSSSGSFQISLQTNADPARKVQYGLRMTGPNLWPENAAPFGGIRVSNAQASAYEGWIAGFDFSAIANPDLSPSGDPDGDGWTNLQEFAFQGNPAQAAVQPNMRAAQNLVGAHNAFVLTLPVRAGASFSGAPALTAGVDGVQYAIEGSSDLDGFAHPIAEVTPALDGGLPALPSGWSYRSFRLKAGQPGEDPAPATGFLRAGVSSAP